MEYSLTLLHSEEIARDTMSLTFAKPDNFEYLAGQSLDLKLSNPLKEDSNGDTRSCTIASSPYEDHIMIAMRIRNTVFKQTLKALKSEDAVSIRGPYGSFIINKLENRPFVFLTGGIGVTPALSMLRQALHDHIPNQLTLIDSNHRPEDAPFIKEFNKLATDYKNFTYIPTMTQADELWTGIKERIDERLIRSVVKDIHEPIYYTCGSMSMVYYLRQLLNKLGIDGENIRSEDFPGY